MNIQELIVASEHKLPIIIAILNNGYLGIVRQWQQMFWEKRYSHTDISFAPDFVKLAEAYKAVGIRVTEKKEVEPAIKKALSVTDRPVVIDFQIAREENIFPFIPTGKTVDDTIMGETE
jgi:acetolactate synthase-1/2/3 large subunit